MAIPLSAIREGGTNVRRMPAGAQADAALEASIRAQGVLVPVLVRQEEDGTYRLIAGQRRVVAARAAGLEEIPALVVDGLVNGHATAAQAAENMVRAPMHPVDQWRAIVQLQADGFSLTAAAASLGLNERFARKLDKLGRLHADVLALIEEYGMPTEHDLAIIALAPPDQQRKAVKAHGKPIKGWNGGRPFIRWRDIAQACRTVRISRNHAIFDLQKAKVTWDEDLFAEPGADDQFTTADAKAFMAAQTAALEAQVKERQAKKERVVLSTWDERNYGVVLPPGFAVSYNAGKPKSTETFYVAVSPDGRIKEQLAIDTKAEKARAAEKAKKVAAKAKDTTAAGGDVDSGEDEAVDDEAPSAPEKLPFTKAGLAYIAATKTAALRAHLRSEDTAERFPPEMLRLTILLLCCRNIEVRYQDVGYDQRGFEDLAAQLLLPGGNVDESSYSKLCGIAGELMARIVGFGNDRNYGGSGVAAEWIGAAIGADDVLPRFDTAEFLAQVNGAELRRAAEAEGIKPPSKVSAMREQLVGKLPNWKPAAFGAPAPVIEPEPAADWAGQEEDEG